MHAELRILASNDETVRTVIIRPGQAFVVGRGDDVSIVLDDPRISRRHAALTLRSDGLFVTDLKSRNGTFLDGARLEGEVQTRLLAGSALRLGAHEITARLVGYDEASLSQTLAAQRHDASLLPADEFEIVEEIGAGAVGRIWVARQKLLNRKVAVKILRWELDPDREEQARFLREARLCSRIRSPYVVDVYDVRVEQGCPIIIMELVQGPNAMDRVQADENPLPIAEALLIGEEVARGLAAAESVGVVHRDVKPGNIILGPDCAKLGDFGIAKDLSGSSLTETGIGLGSLPYASPEQVVEARGVDHRADIYGLGATLYHLITGSPPFGRDLDIFAARRVIQSVAPRPLREQRPDCPRPVEAFVLQMLAKQPDERPQEHMSCVRRLADLRRRCYPDWRRAPRVDPHQESQEEWIPLD